MEQRNHSPAMLLLLFALWCIFTGFGNPVNPSTSCGGCFTTGSNYPVPSSSYSPDSSRGGLSEAEIEFRTNLVKMKILKALNLVEPPNVTTPLPEIPYNFEEMSFEEEKETKMLQPSPVFLIGRKVDEGCASTPESVCYRFQQESKTVCGIKSEKLWVFVQNSSNSGNDLLVFKSHSNGSVQRIAKLDSHLNGWVSVDLQPWNRVGLLEEKNREISFSYGHSSSDAIHQLVRVFEAHIPLIEVTMEECSNQGQQRMRRSITAECVSGSNPQCCLQEFTVNFSEIGWTWIRQPQTIQANYCRGRCDFRHLSPLEVSHRTLMYLSWQQSRNNDMLPCCVAVEKTYFHVLIYINDTVVPRRIRGVSATACECY